MKNRSGQNFLNYSQSFCLKDLREKKSFAPNVPFFTKIWFLIISIDVVFANSIKDDSRAKNSNRIEEVFRGVPRI